MALRELKPDGRPVVIRRLDFYHVSNRTSSFQDLSHPHARRFTQKFSDCILIPVKDFEKLVQGVCEVRQCDKKRAEEILRTEWRGDVTLYCELVCAPLPESPNACKALYAETVEDNAKQAALGRGYLKPGFENAWANMMGHLYKGCMTDPNLPISKGGCGVDMSMYIDTKEAPIRYRNSSVFVTRRKTVRGTNWNESNNWFTKAPLSGTTSVGLEYATAMGTLASFQWNHDRSSTAEGRNSLAASIPQQIDHAVLLKKSGVPLSEEQKRVFDLYDFERGEKEKYGIDFYVDYLKEAGVDLPSLEGLGVSSTADVSSHEMKSYEDAEDAAEVGGPEEDDGYREVPEGGQVDEEPRESEFSLPPYATVDQKRSQEKDKSIPNGLQHQNEFDRQDEEMKDVDVSRPSPLQAHDHLFPMSPPHRNRHGRPCQILDCLNRTIPQSDGNMSQSALTPNHNLPRSANRISQFFRRPEKEVALGRKSREGDSKATERWSRPSSWDDKDSDPAPSPASLSRGSPPAPPPASLSRGSPSTPPLQQDFISVETAVAELATLKEGKGEQSGRVRFDISAWVPPSGWVSQGDLLLLPKVDAVNGDGGAAASRQAFEKAMKSSNSCEVTVSPLSDPALQKVAQHIHVSLKKHTNKGMAPLRFRKYPWRRSGDVRQTGLASAALSHQGFGPLASESTAAASSGTTTVSISGVHPGGTSSRKRRSTDGPLNAAKILSSVSPVGNRVMTERLLSLRNEVAAEKIDVHSEKGILEICKRYNNEQFRLALDEITIPLLPIWAPKLHEFYHKHDEKEICRWSAVPDLQQAQGHEASASSGTSLTPEG
uniref:Uncharacterized protein n=1 Tax=Chromera velia CCMP2878 TaxID=1169474 RepID=A0A0G4I7B3_9ALVE|eukprot:Cvel_11555.t1-p1 / transcript=Cvel_11555.t1 / gene=Cvel_11555 / organism=Chromera_velia_CCMP2878 / gene_product=hypothetical protein / transcript_product=hypothetical protein / location=Cvel_scaffold730:12189-16802(+) / protein_length=826 / sequence_SO=supercontig / SO=protein_coding / is_pseudo=false